MNDSGAAATDRQITAVEEAGLIELASSGDVEAFEGLYRMHSKNVYSLCLRMVGDTHAAEDITQEIFVRLWDKLQTFRGESSFSTWLLPVVLQRHSQATFPHQSPELRSPRRGNDHRVSHGR